MIYFKTFEQFNNDSDTYFVVRDTSHPIEDLKRNWSTFAGGSSIDGHFYASDVVNYYKVSNSRYVFELKY